MDMRFTQFFGRAIIPSSVAAMFGTSTPLLSMFASIPAADFVNTFR
jgi:hypothetical protein